MKFKWVVLCVVLVCVVTACGAKESLDPPAEAFKSFRGACDAGDMSEVEIYLTDKAIQATKKGWLPCETYSHNGLNFDSKWVDPDSIEYREWDTDEFEEQIGQESGYDGILEVADLKWFVEGEMDPMEENPPSENTTYISAFEVLMIKIDGEWKIDCVFC